LPHFRRRQEKSPVDS